MQKQKTTRIVPVGFGYQKVRRTFRNADETVVQEYIARDPSVGMARLMLYKVMGV